MLHANFYTKGGCFPAKAHRPNAELVGFFVDLFFQIGQLAAVVRGAEQDDPAASLAALLGQVGIATAPLDRTLPELRRKLGAAALTTLLALPVSLGGWFWGRMAGRFVAVFAPLLAPYDPNEVLLGDGVTRLMVRCAEPTAMRGAARSSP